MSRGLASLSLEPLHLQDLAQNPLHIFIHLALGWGDRGEPGRPATVQTGNGGPESSQGCGQSQG